MLGTIVVSTYTESIEDFKKKYITPFSTLDLLIGAKEQQYETDLPESVVSRRESIQLDGRHYWHYHFAFQTDTLYPGHCISKENVMALGCQDIPVSAIEAYAVNHQMHHGQINALFKKDISMMWLQQRKKLLTQKKVSPLRGHFEKTPTYRHIIEIQSQDTLNRILATIRGFFEYRPHETHYAIQGLMLCTQVVQATLSHQGKLYNDFESLIQYYPRIYFKSRSGCAISSKHDVIWQLDQSYQYVQMAVYLHQLIRRSVYRHGQDMLSLNWLGYGRSVPEILCLDIYNHLIKAGQYSPKQLAHDIEFRVVRFANGYIHLPGVLRILPDQVSYLLMKGVLKQGVLNQKAIWRLMDALKYHRMPPMPIEYLRKVYKQLVHSQNGRMMMLNRFELLVAHGLRRVPDDSIDLMLGDPSLERLKMDKSLMLLQKNYINPSVSRKKNID